MRYVVQYLQNSNYDDITEFSRNAKWFVNDYRSARIIAQFRDAETAAKFAEFLND